MKLKALATIFTTAACCAALVAPAAASAEAASQTTVHGKVTGMPVTKIKFSDAGQCLVESFPFTTNAGRDIWVTAAKWGPSLRTDYTGTPRSAFGYLAMGAVDPANAQELEVTFKNGRKPPQEICGKKAAKGSLLVVKASPA
jgi:hypothetical protein